ncbi:MAG: glycosyltransferase family 4 protein [Acidobacteriota bacterium]|nr:glycosyltransferase family 4 protein [Acidobacteriota bacterium]
MHVGIDASNLRVGGGVTHLVELLRAADPREDSFDRITVWAGSRTLQRIEERPWLDKIYDRLLDGALHRRVYWQRARLPELAAAAGCDVLFVPGGSDASGFRPLVTMSRNLLPFEWREARRYGFGWLTLKNVLLRWSQKRTFRRADGLIFLTRYSQKIVMTSLGRASGKVTVISHGIDARFARAPRPQEDIAAFSVERPFRLLYVSIVDAYKHQWVLAEAVARLRAEGLPLTLELVGAAYPPALERLNETLRRVDPDARFIRYRGAVPYDELHDVYASAHLNLFASSCENMPNILLEGMAAGLPIACSNRGPMPEVLGNAGVYFDPERPDDVAAAIRALVESPSLRTRVAGAAFDRARQFSWARCARETFAFLETVTVNLRGTPDPISPAIP